MAQVELQVDTDGVTQEWSCSIPIHYEAVDGATPNEADYVYHATKSDVEEFGIQNFTEDYSVINYVQVRVYGQTSTGSSGIINLGLFQPVLGRTASETDDVLPDGSWGYVLGDQFTVNPVDSQPWETSDITNLRISLETPSNFPRNTTIQVAWCVIIVDYDPPSAATRSQAIIIS